ncbi:MAG: winged helix-turn-helix transcriptional regulator [Gaiellaceae bacterium]
MTQRTDFAAMSCSVARAWSIIGEPWTPLILRDLALGLSRFDDLQADLGIARNVLADRLRTLNAAGVVAKQSYQSSNRRRAEYVLTEMGRELIPVIVVLSQWGDRWLDDGAGPPIVFEHSCGAVSRAEIVCNHCRETLAPAEVTASAGPGSRSGPGSYAANALPKTPET